MLVYMNYIRFATKISKIIIQSQKKVKKVIHNILINFKLIKKINNILFLQ